MQNYYEVLEVNKCASQEVIEKIYKIHIKKYHPDLYQDDKKAEMEEKLKKIVEAYEVLSDPEKRKEHDKELEKVEREKFEQEHNVNVETNTEKYERNVVDEKDYSDKNTDIMLNQLNRFETVLNRYEQIFQNYDNTVMEANNKENKVSNFDILKYKLKKVLMIIGIVAITVLVLYFLPFTRNILNNIIAIFTKK